MKILRTLRGIEAQLQRIADHITGEGWSAIRANSFSFSKTFREQTYEIKLAHLKVDNDALRRESVALKKKVEALAATVEESDVGIFKSINLVEQLDGAIQRIDRLEKSALPRCSECGRPVEPMVLDHEGCGE